MFFGVGCFGYIIISGGYFNEKKAVAIIDRYDVSVRCRLQQRK